MRPVEDSDTREIEENTPEEGDIVLPSTKQMNSLEMWVHANKNILLNGTTSLKTPEAPEGEEWDDDRATLELKKLLEADPQAPLLHPISQDSKIQVSKTLQQPSWTVRLMGDATEYMDGANKPQSNGVVVARSLTWPGAYSFYCNSRWQQIYLGNGHKYEQNATFYPVEPPLIECDPSEYEGPEEPEQHAPKVEEPVEKENENGDEPVEEE